ncbi:GmrSD restriction endonuclease domain-containing protein [Bradyrhizobium barranii]
MAVPDFQTLMLPLLKFAGDGKEHTIAEALEQLAKDFQLSEEDRAQLLQSGQTRFYNRLGWATTYLKKAGLLQAMGPGRFQWTDRGRNLLATRPAVIDVAFLDSQFPEISAFRSARGKRQVIDEQPPAIFNVADGTWNQREGVEERVRRTLETSIPNAAIRLEALRFLASAIEVADEENSNGWYLRETERGLRLMTGRVLAFEIGPSKLRVSVMGPIGEDVRLALEVETEKDTEFKHVPGGLLLTFPLDHAAEAQGLLKHDFNNFVDEAMARVRRSVNLVDHVPEAVTYVASFVGRGLPQPVADPPKLPESNDSELDGDDPSISREPRVRGRAPIFEHGQRSIASLMSDIERGVIALPDLQRPFVWEDTGARQLLDSLFLGFPVGTLVFWHTSNDMDARALGAERPGLRATTLVIDGQQRLTSLYAVMRGVDVIGKDGETRKIMIAFRPRDGRFEVSDAAIRNDPEFLHNITELWDGRRLPSQIRRDLVNGLRDRGRAVDDKYEDAVDRNLGRAHAITDYRFPTVDIRKTAATQADEITDEDVAEIFVRINNQGTRLGQADFVLTLLSVFHGGLRDRIEERARVMSQGTVVGIDTQQLLRAVCGVAFGRARMSAIYRYLRGVDPTTGEADPNERVKRLDQLDEAAKLCMETTPWRDYLLRVQHAGFVNPSLIGSKNAIVNGYALYVRGRKVGVPKSKLDEAIARWVFGTLLTARYSTASETIFEQDLARVARLKSDDSDGFVQVLDESMGEALTGDYWGQTLVSALETEKARAPAALAFRAAQVVLGTRALFSDQFLRNLLDPPSGGARAASEAHHLFPTAWLHSRGVRERRFVNQVANLAAVGWHENSMISGRSPGEYVPRLREKLGILDENRWGRMCAEHALPLGWESMEYKEFLLERRRRMADIIRVAFRQLGGEADAPPLTPPWFLPGGEDVWRRIAETERALRGVVREVYASRFGHAAAQRIEGALPDRERDILARALRARPVVSEPLSIVDYLYLGQIPPLLFTAEAQQAARQRLGGAQDVKQRLLSAVNQIAPVRNEIAHVREVDRERLLRASVACADVLEMLQQGETRDRLASRVDT